MNRRNRKRPALQKEKVSIIAASVFVLSALTLAGVYMAAQNDGGTEENRIDFAKLEQQQNSVTEENKAVNEEDRRFVSGKVGTNSTLADSRFTRGASETNDLSNNNDMDVDPEYTEVNSGQVTNTPITASIEGTDKAAVFMGEEASEDTAAVVEDNAAEAALSFSDASALQLPVVGEVLMDYSMDKAVYHGTMQQYRYNPALVIAATEGEIVTAAADGIVTNVYYDAQTGNTISFNLGDGYELTYGQLADITLNVGDRVAAGDMVGMIAAPTIYYTQEGPNIYLKLTKDGEPVDPLDIVQ